jgi:hypothetical protein
MKSRTNKTGRAGEEEMIDWSFCVRRKDWGDVHRNSNGG